MTVKPSLEELTTFCKKKGFVFQAAEIYGGLAGFFDFGPLGVELKNNLKQLYWRDFVHKKDNIVGQDGAIITNPTVWKASGHLDTFGDLILTTKDTKTKLRADHFIEDELNIPGDGLSAEDINSLIKKHHLTYNGEELEEVKDFNLMFATQVGADTTKNATAYLRPETAQSIFPNFRAISEVSRKQLPFGITQIGKAYRNEISPRDFVFRCREFEQIETEFFFNPQTTQNIEEDLLQIEVNFLSANDQDNGVEENKIISFKELLNGDYNLNSYHVYWLIEHYLWFTKTLQLNPHNLRIREHTNQELSHYSTATFDIDYNYPMGFKELLGMANRTNYDLYQHQTHSKTKMEIFDEATQTKVLPHVIEPSFGVERLFMAVLQEGYTPRDDTIYLNIPPIIAPVDVAVFPLMNKEELINPAINLHKTLQDQNCISIYDKSGTIGKRYARQDEQGTQFTITIDYETIEKGEKYNTVTIRNAYTKEQKRIVIDLVPETIRKLKYGVMKFDDI